MKFYLFLLAVLWAVPVFAQQNIDDVRNLPEGTTVTVTGIITNGSELGPIRYIQDKTGGLGIYDAQLGSVNRGDSITVTGEIHPFYNLFEITLISSVTIHSSGNPLPQPKVITIDEIGEDYEGQLIQVNNITIDNSAGTFSGNVNYSFYSGSKTGELRINKDSPAVGQPIPTKPVNLIAICSQYSTSLNDTQTGYQLLPRDMDDFISNQSVNIISVPVVKNITNGGFTLSWETDVDATAEVFFGTSPDSESWTDISEGTSTQQSEGFLHEVTISGLEPANIIYAQCFSVLGSDTALSNVGTYATQSLSTGKMNVYFNTPVDVSLAKETQAQYIGTAMEDTLIAYINRATETIDFCIYNINNSGLTNVSSALNDALNRGVRIRLITCGTTNHFGVNDLNAEIPVLERPVIPDDGIMHNKFAIFDANSSNPDKPWVWTGSANLTDEQINSDANNIIFIQDQTLAKAYQIEFEEMWGSTGSQPNALNARFGENKKDNTPHFFNINNNLVECYFSPSDGTNQKIIDAINTANNDLEIETMLITRTDLANAILNAYYRGAEVRVITDAADGNTTTVNNILNSLPQGENVTDLQTYGLLHNKLAIIDANLTTSDPEVITGSHNWSNSANTINDENTLIIHSAELANIYFQQFAQRFKDDGGDLYVLAETESISGIKVFPNPTDGMITIQSFNPVSKIQIYSLDGTKTDEIMPENLDFVELNLNGKSNGMYLLKVLLRNGKQNTYNIVKQ